MSDSKAGNLYEQQINNLLKRAKVQPAAFNKAPSDHSKPDAIFIKNKKQYGIEVKHKYDTSYGSITIKHNGRAWVLHETTENSEIVNLILKPLRLIDIINRKWKKLGCPHKFKYPPGKTPPEGEKIADLFTWSEEGKKQHGIGVTINMPIPAQTIINYYAAKKTDYIQIKGKGFYYLIKDSANLGVPQFDPTKTYAEARMKTDHKKESGITYYTFNILLKHSTDSKFVKSNFDLDKDIGFLK